MKNTFKRIIAATLVAILLVGTAPLESLTGIDFGGLFGIETQAWIIDETMIGSMTDITIGKTSQGITPKSEGLPIFDIITNGLMTQRTIGKDHFFQFMMDGKTVLILPSTIEYGNEMNVRAANDIVMTKIDKDINASLFNTTSKRIDDTTEKQYVLANFESTSTERSWEFYQVQIVTKKQDEKTFSLEFELQKSCRLTYKKNAKNVENNLNRVTLDSGKRLERKQTKNYVTPSSVFFVVQPGGGNQKDGVFLDTYVAEGQGSSVLGDKASDYVLLAVETIIDVASGISAFVSGNLLRTFSSYYNIVKTHVGYGKKTTSNGYTTRTMNLSKLSNEIPVVSLSVKATANAPLRIAGDYFKYTVKLSQDRYSYPDIPTLLKVGNCIKIGNGDNSISIDALEFFSGNVKNSPDENIKFASLSNSSIQGHSATLSGKITNLNNIKIKSYGVYVKKGSDNFSSSDAKWTNNNTTSASSVNVSRTIGGLEPNTRYYYAIFAKASNGYTYCSSAKSFKTLKVKPENFTMSSINTINYRNNQKMNSSELGVGDSVYVKWNAAKYAEWYTINVGGVDTGKKYKGTNATLTLNNPSDEPIPIEVRAHNTVGSSDWTAPISVTVHPDVNIKFMVGDKEYQRQQLTWGHDLDKLPEIPSQLGMAFAGWYLEDDTTIANFNVIKSDLTVHAKYVENKYTVKFCDQYGNIIEGSEQIVEYAHSAIAPTDMSFVKKDYQFVGWNKSFESVKENLTVTAVVDWEKNDLPTEVTNVEATRYSYGYVIECDVTNLDDVDTAGRIIVALKTDAGKLITTTESAAYFVGAREVNPDNGSYSFKTEHIKTVVPNLYDDETENLTAFSAEVYSVKNFRTVVPVSSKVTSTIFDADPWSDWKPTTRDGYTEETTQTKLQYRTRSIMFDTVIGTPTKKQKVAEGWICYKTDDKMVESDWSKTRPQEQEDRVIEEKEIAAVTKTTYWYKRYTYFNEAHGVYYYSYGSTWATNMGYSGKWEYKSTSSPLEQIDTVDGKAKFSGTWYRADCSSQGTAHTKYKVTTVVTPAYTLYKSKDPKYYLNKWPEEFSEWTIAPIDNLGTSTESADGINTYGNTEIVNGVPITTVENQTRNLYRYYDGLPVREYDNEGTERNDFTIGAVDAALAGKQATLVIYKINEAADWTIEHIDQTTINDDGTYMFEYYKLREEPSSLTGDMTAVLGIEGSTGSYYLGTINTPKPQYTVKYVNQVTNEVLSIQEIEQGDNATPPVPPENEGYTFSHWDMRSTNISEYMVDETSDTNEITINAVYEKNRYTVVFIDWTHNLYDIQSYLHGDKLEPPVLEGSNIFDISWDIDWGVDLESYPKVEANMVITAKYVTKVFTVDFYDYDMNIIDSQQVEYGQSPIAPLLDSDDAHIMYGWSTNHDALLESYEEPQEVAASEGDDGETSMSISPNQLISVEDFEIETDCAMYPQFWFSETTAIPTADVATGAYNGAQTVTLSCETQGAEIYYTLDGTDPKAVESDDIPEEERHVKTYTAPITISVSTELNFYAKSLGMNGSDVASEFYAINDGQGSNKYILKLAVDSLDDVYYTGIVDAGTKLDEALIPVLDGHTLEGVYRTLNYIPAEEEDLDGTVEYADPWDIETDTITADTTLYLKYNVESYTVEFVDFDGFVFDTQTVEYYSSAVAPEDPVRDGYVFTGWDSESYLTVLGDTTLTATYVPEDEYVRVSLDRAKYTMMSGSSYTLTATTTGNVANPELIWYSSDDSVATVDENGNITAVGKGTCQIAVSVADNAETAICTLTVWGNPTREICLKDNTNISVDEATGFIGGFRVVTDEDTELHHSQTVAEIRANFSNDELVFVSSSGDVLADTDYIGTGTTIKLMDGDIELDAVTVILAGDMDGNGYVNNRDAARMSRYLVDKETPDMAQLTAIDVNGDGYVNNRDASLISRYLVGKEVI